MFQCSEEKEEEEVESSATRFELTSSSLARRVPASRRPRPLSPVVAE